MEGCTPYDFKERSLLFYAIERVVVVLTAQPADGHRGSGRLKGSAAGPYGSRHQHCQLGKTAAVERKFDDTFVIHSGSHRGGIGLQLHGNAADFDPLGNLADFQRQIDAESLVYFELEALLNGCPEARHLGLPLCKYRAGRAGTRP